MKKFIYTSLAILLISNGLLWYKEIMGERLSEETETVEVTSRQANTEFSGKNVLGYINEYDYYNNPEGSAFGSKYTVAVPDFELENALVTLTTSDGREMRFTFTVPEGNKRKIRLSFYSASINLENPGDQAQIRIRTSDAMIVLQNFVAPSGSGMSQFFMPVYVQGVLPGEPGIYNVFVQTFGSFSSNRPELSRKVVTGMYFMAEYI